MKGKPSWQLLLIGPSRFPADQNRMQCGLKEGERATSTAAGAGEASRGGGAEQTDRRGVGHTRAVTGSPRRRGRKRQLSPPDSNTNTQTPPCVPIRGQRSSAESQKSLLKLEPRRLTHIFQGEIRYVTIYDHFGGFQPNNQT